MTATDTFEQILDRYAADIAFAAFEEAATTPSEFIDQLVVASRHFADAAINGWEDLDTAATYLAGAMDGSDDEQRVLLRKADDLLTAVSDMRDEYKYELMA